MRIFILSLAVIVPAFAIAPAKAADAVPKFNIAANCAQETAGAIAGGSEGCTRDENQAKNELVQSWSSYGAAAKRDCISESRTGGEQSYVELLTCLEMSTGHYTTTGQGR